MIYLSMVAVISSFFIALLFSVAIVLWSSIWVIKKANQLLQNNNLKGNSTSISV